MLLQSKIDEVNSTLSDIKLPGVSDTSLQHSESHSEDGTKKRSAKNRKYYETHKARTLANQKQKYKENAEVEKAASRLRCDANPETQKAAAHASSKAKYRANPETQKAAAHVRYAKNPKLKLDALMHITHETSKAFAQKEGTNIHCASQSLLK